MNKFHKYTLILFPALLLTALNLNAQITAPAPYGVLPSERQLKWQETEMYCLIHFTPTTFQNKEWGYGDAKPSLFNPTKFDADKIVAAAKSGGFKGIVFVAKHHDGFALWPTATSNYNISESPWKGGKGDMVKDFQLAANKAGLKYGIYCSPWDRNNTSYGTAEYVEVYRKQLTELYSNYGNLFMSWHDGANGGDGSYGGKNEKRQVDQSSYYDWPNTWSITRKLQPDAAIFSDIGPDVRWVGNEKGIGAETAWSTITIKGKDDKTPMPGYLNDYNLSTGTRNGNQWIPFEGDVSLRPGWFYHVEEDKQVKTTAELFNIYCSSVGRGGALDLGLSPTTEGVLHPYDIAALAEFGNYIKNVFADNIAKQAEISVSNIRGNQNEFNVSNLTDTDRYSYWATDDEVHQATVTLNFKKPVTFSLLQLRENIKLGQRIDSVTAEIYKDKKWVKLAGATSIGANRIIRLTQEVNTSKMRIKIYAPVSITLSEVGLYRAPSLTSKASAIADKVYDKNSWKVKNDERSITIDFGKDLKFSALSYLPNQNNTSAGAIQKYELFSSNNGTTWNSISQGEFSNIKANPIKQFVRLAQPESTRYIRLVAKQAVPGNNGKVQLNIEQLDFYIK